MTTCAEEDDSSPRKISSTALLPSRDRFSVMVLSRASNDGTTSTSLGLPQSALGEERPAVTLPRITPSIAIARLAVERALGEDVDLRTLDEDFGGRWGRGRDDGAVETTTAKAARCPQDRGTMMIAMMVSIASAA